MVNQDRILLETYEKKNELESLAYNWKEKLQGSHKPYAKPDGIPHIISHMEQISEWLYGEGQDSNRGTYAQKIEEAHAKIMDIQKRYDLYEGLVNEFIIFNNILKQNFDSINTTDSKYSHITAEERQPLIQEIQGHYNWIKSIEDEHNKRPRWENPVINVHDVRTRINDINDKTKKLLSKPVAKPAEPTKMEEEKPADNSTKMDEEKK